MPTATLIERPTRGKVLAVNDDSLVFAPFGTSYELFLKTAERYAGPTNAPVEVVIRATARKVWTVPSGGNFIAPIIGPPKIIQGRVVHADEKQLVVRAGAMFLIDLPTTEHAIDLPSGPITVGSMVNVTAFAGATAEIVARHQASGSPGVAHVGTPGDAPEAVG
jgi:hypothetical protein